MAGLAGPCGASLPDRRPKSAVRAHPGGADPSITHRGCRYFDLAAPAPPRGDCGPAGRRPATVAGDPPVGGARMTFEWSMVPTPDRRELEVMTSGPADA